MKHDPDARPINEAARRQIAESHMVADEAGAGLAREAEPNGSALGPDEGRPAPATCETCDQLRVVIERLQAEVERLRNVPRACGHGEEPMCRDDLRCRDICDADPADICPDSSDGPMCTDFPDCHTDEHYRTNSTEGK